MKSKQVLLSSISEIIIIKGKNKKDKFFNALWLFLFISILTFFGCASIPGKNDPPNLVLIKNPIEIVEPKEDIKIFFKHEWGTINQRRDHSIGIDQPPRHTIGLALSGGGIRSNAFQLGILAGFYEAGLLPEIDYLSTVSGGSWAAASYLFTNYSDQEFFNELDQFDSRHLLKKQGKFYRDGWRKEIIKGVLPKGEELLYKDLPSKKRLIKKPYFIINATHSNKPTEFPSEQNFNIQFTRDAIIAPADCRSKDGLCDRWLQEVLWSMIPTAGGTGRGFMISNRERSNYKFYVNTPPLPWLYTQELRVSDILAASSAVVTKSYGNWIRIKKNGIVVGGQSEENLRDKYRLSDGGKSENLGAIALMQRGVDMVIVSQMAYDPNLEFSDLELLNAQLKKKFGMQVDECAIKEKIKYSCQLYAESKYEKINGDSKRDIFFIKPTYINIYGFNKWLETKLNLNPQFQVAFDALNEKSELTNKNKCNISNKKFPQHPTFSLKYKKGIIEAYYLLGKYVIETTDITNKIKRRVALRQKE